MRELAKAACARCATSKGVVAPTSNKQYCISGAGEVDCVRKREHRRGVDQYPVKVR